MADPAQEALLQLQEHDTALEQLRHRRRTLPQRDELNLVETTLARLEADREVLETRRGELSRSLRRLEDEVASVEAKAAELDAKMYSGTVSSPRELQAMQDEIAALKRRQSSLEDDELEIMELAEPVNAELEEKAAERARLDERGAELRAAITEAEVAIDAEIAEVEAARASDAEVVPPALLSTYDTLRPRLDGVAVARLDGNRCTGCHLTLPATEVDQIKHQPADTVVRHEECGRILVR